MIPGLKYYDDVTIAIDDPKLMQACKNAMLHRIRTTVNGHFGLIVRFQMLHDGTAAVVVVQHVGGPQACGCHCTTESRRD